MRRRFTLNNAAAAQSSHLNTDVREVYVVDTPSTTLWIQEHHVAIYVPNRRGIFVEISKIVRLHEIRHLRQRSFIS